VTKNAFRTIDPFAKWQNSAPVLTAPDDVSFQTDECRKGDLLKSEAPNNLSVINHADDQVVAKRQQISGEQHRHKIANVNTSTLYMENRWTIGVWRKLITLDSSTWPDAKPDPDNLENDPSEMADLSAKQPEKVVTLSQQIDLWWHPFQLKN
jgi:hypothetical protein